MKNIGILFLFLLSHNCFAQKNIDPKKPLTLTAVRNNYSYSYRISSAVKVIFIKDGERNSIKGRLAKATPEGIYISSFIKDTSLTLIAVDSIFSVKKLLRKLRKTTGIIMGITTAGGVIFGDQIDNNLLGTALLVVGLIPAVISSYTFIGSYLYELVDQKSIRNGWIFKVQEYRSF